MDLRLDRCVTVIQGEDRLIGVTVMKDDATFTPQDLTGVTEIVAVFIKRDGSALEKKLSVSPEVVIVGEWPAVAEAYQAKGIPVRNVPFISCPADIEGTGTPKGSEIPPPQRFDGSEEGHGARHGRDRGDVADTRVARPAPPRGPVHRQAGDEQALCDRDDRGGACSPRPGREACRACRG
mgnify:CR=1 FL=1